MVTAIPKFPYTNKNKKLKQNKQKRPHVPLRPVVHFDKNISTAFLYSIEK